MNYFVLAAYGELSGIEFCWRRHDECENLKPKEIKNGLENDEEQCYWHCNCDLEFYHCLHRINSTVSNHIGELYFSYNTRCYRMDRDIKDCYVYDYRGSAETKRCVRYVLDLKTRVEYQWFDLPFYSGKPMESPIYDV